MIINQYYLELFDILKNIKVYSVKINYREM